MIYILLSLVGGIVIGYFFPPQETGSKNIQRLTMAGLFLLLAAMGAQLGSNDRVLSNLHRLGLQALILASLSVLGSIAAVFFVFRRLGTDKDGRFNKRGED